MPPQLNADGFGLCWYGIDHSKKRNGGCLFKSTVPAWLSKNLFRLCDKISSPLIFGHVRAASPGSSVAEDNCHPFIAGPFTFMHNGGVGNFPNIKDYYVKQFRHRNDVYKIVRGTTDSEHVFGVFLSYLPKKAILLNKITHRYEFLNSNIILEAFKKTLSFIVKTQQETRSKTGSALNFAVTDGNTTICARVTVETRDGRDPACPMCGTLYYSKGYGFVKKRMSELIKSRRNSRLHSRDGSGSTGINALLDINDIKEIENEKNSDNDEEETLYIDDDSASYTEFSEWDQRENKARMSSSQSVDNFSSSSLSLFFSSLSLF